MGTVGGRLRARLTPHQHAVLASMAAGARLTRWHTLGRLGKQHVALSPDGSPRRNVGMLTYEALRAAGYIAALDDQPARGSTTYAVTGAGLAALEPAVAG